MSALRGQTLAFAPRRDPLDEAARARARRVTLIVAATILMGIADLVCTWTYMSTVGMIEMNPVARAMISIGGGAQLIRYKLFTMMLSAGTLYLCRHKRAAELWAIVCAAIMLALTAHWVVYNAAVQHMTHEISLLAASTSEDRPPTWVVLGE